MPEGLRVLVVGAGVYVCGRGTPGYGTVLPALAEARRDGLVSAVGVAARSAASRRTLASKHAALCRFMGVRLPLEPESAGRWDCALVVTPDHTHFSQTSRLLKAGLHCLVVKPLTPTLAEARALARLASDRGLYGAVEYHKRFDEANLKLAEAVRSGRLGELRYAAVEYSQRRSIPLEAFRGWAARTNIFQYLGVHYADVIHFVSGARPLRAAALGQRGWLSSRGVATYDSVQALVEWEAPAPKPHRFVSSLLVNWIDPETTTAMSDQRIKVVGTRGRFESDQKDRGVTVVLDGAPPETLNPYFSQFYPSPDGRGRVFRGYGERSFRRFLADVADLRSGARRPRDLEGLRPTFRSALASTAVVDAVNRSLARGGAWERA